MRAGPRMQAVVPNALSNRANNNSDSIHARGELSSQCHISGTKESAIGRLMNGGQIFFSARFCSSSVLPSPVDYMEQGGRGLGLIHEYLWYVCLVF